VYHPQVIKRRIQEIVDRGEVNFRPAYHTTDEVAEVSEHLKRLWDPEGGKLLRALEPWEQQWISNERLLCRCDYLYWATRYAFIRNIEGRMIRYQPNVAQRILHSIRAEHELNAWAIMLQEGKARQLGVSTDSELVVCHRVQFYPHVNAVVGSSDPKKSGKMAQIIERALAHQPFFLIPHLTRSVVDELIEFGDQDSAVSIQSGSQVTGIARGDSLTVCHLSELCNFRDPEELVDSSLFRAMHNTPWTVLILESTALGKRNWWHKTWLHAKENWPLRRSRLRPNFLPWYVGTDLYPTSAWLREHPVPDGWRPPDYVLKHAEKAEAYCHANDLLRQHMGANWRMSVEQMWFYDVERSEAAAKDELNKFLQEMPADDIEMFQSTAVSVFDTETITLYRDNCARQPPKGVYGLVGPPDEVPLRLQPSRSQIDESKEPIEIVCNWGTARHAYKLFPLRWQGYSNDSGMGKIYIYEWPEPEQEYGLGIDTSDGIGLDRSCIELMRKGNLYQNDAQAAEYCYDYINAFDLWPFALALGTFYGVKRNGMRRQPRVAIECKGNGETTQLQMRLRGWSNFHQWIRYDQKNLRKSKATRLGVFTNYWFRAMMMDYLIKWLRDGWVEIRSPWFVEEMADLERNEDVQSLKAMHGGHDDRILSMGFNLVSLYDTEIRRGVKPGEAGERVVIRQRADEPRQYVKYSEGWQGGEIAGEAAIRSFLPRPEALTGVGWR
jgi:hypothetical protein